MDAIDFQTVLELIKKTDWLIGGVVGLFAISALGIARKLLIARLRLIARKTDTILDDVALAVAMRTRKLGTFILFTSVFFIFYQFPEARHQNLARKGLILLIFLQVAIWASGALDVWWKSHTSKKIEDDPAQKASLNLLGIALRFVLFSIVLLLCLRNLGVDISALVAGLGVGGIAVALAVQNILGDLFASLTIVLDKPFVVGDFVNVGELSGTVENVGLKTTRLRSLSGEQLVFSNSDLLSSRLRNYKRMIERRVVFQVGVTYQTSQESLETIPGLLKKAIESQQSVRFDRAHMFQLGASSLDFEAVYWILSSEYNVFARIHEQVLFSLFKEFAEAKIDFAYPTRTLFIEKPE